MQKIVITYFLEIQYRVRSDVFKRVRNLVQMFKYLMKSGLNVFCNKKTGMTKKDKRHLRLEMSKKV